MTCVSHSATSRFTTQTWTPTQSREVPRYDFLGGGEKGNVETDGHTDTRAWSGLPFSGSSSVRKRLAPWLYCMDGGKSLAVNGRAILIRP